MDRVRGGRAAPPPYPRRPDPRMRRIAPPRPSRDTGPPPRHAPVPSLQQGPQMTPQPPPQPVQRTDANGNDGLGRLLDHVAGLAPVRAAMVHPCDPLSLAAVLDVRDAGLVEPVLVAPRARLDAAAAEAGLDISGIPVEDVPHSHAAALRAAGLARDGEVEILIKGSLHTDELMSAVVASASGLRTKRRVSHCFVIQTPHYPRPFLVTDAAVNLAPDLRQKADIVQNAIDLARVLGIAEPKVAILAAVETVNPSMPATLDAAALCKMADRGQI
ncbi:MAG: bifunctional enoyl-CoA hydratase/phosphate acetyltransferase, partial [Gammaproteobacteria bacterium]|nr:bifunctional enoyl-CoA hydratase/phosphate acetyltransferase [Gammaproteobacteria bacterium]